MGVYGSLFIRRNKSTELVLEFLRAIRNVWEDWDLPIGYGARHELPDHETVERINKEDHSRFVDEFHSIFKSSAYLDEILASVHKVNPPPNAPASDVEASEDEECYVSGIRNLFQDRNDGPLFIFALIAFVLGVEITIRAQDETEDVGNYYSIVPPEHSLNLHTFERLRYYLEDRQGELDSKCSDEGFFMTPEDQMADLNKRLTEEILRRTPISVEEGFQLWLSAEDLSEITRPVGFTREEAQKFMVDYLKCMYSTIEKQISSSQART